MRIIAFFLILTGILLVADAAHDQRRWIASVTSLKSGERQEVSRAEDPERFRGMMAYEWMRGPLLILGGFIILSICRRANVLDPFVCDAREGRQ